tara:strand:- start:3375 stop:3599 length:225 start_codon:yes stop_codon:yes gene_type:complete
MKFLVFTKNRCSFCDRAKILIEQKGHEYESINIEEDNNIDILLEKNKYARTMPQIFINDKLIGGYEDLVKYFEE